MEKSSFFNAVNVGGNWDRTYKAEDFAAYFGEVITNGIFPSPNTNLQVISNNDMTVTVNGGSAFINGYMYHNTDDLILPIDVADGVLKRIDLIVVRLDHVNREIKSYVKKGTFASAPVKPTLTRNAEIYELCIAELNIEKGIVEVTQDKIIDTRLDNRVCGVVSSLIEVDTEEIYSQMRGLIEQREEEFFKWFNDLKINLDGNVATNLQSQINTLKDDVLENSTSEDLLNENVTSFKVGAGTFEGLKKDYTDQMTQTLVNLENIDGKNDLAANRYHSKHIHAILTNDGSTELPIPWDSPTAVYNNAKYKYDTSIKALTVQATDKTWAAVSYTVPVEPGIVYGVVGHWSTTSNSCYIRIQGVTSRKTYYSKRYDNTNVGVGLFDTFLIDDKIDTNVEITFYSNISSLNGYTNYFDFKLLPNAKMGCEPQIDLGYVNDSLYDEVRGNTLYKKLEFLGKPHQLDWKESASNSSDKDFLVYYASLPWLTTVTDNDWNIGYCPWLENKPYGYTASATSSSTSPDYSVDCFSAHNELGELRIKINRTTASTVDSLKKWLSEGVFFYLKKSVEDKQHTNISFLVNKKDVVYIDSPVPITCTHKINLNTKAQVEETQKIIETNVKSIFDIKKFINSLKFSYSFATNGYIKFPDIFGGLLIQWGSMIFTTSVLDTTVILPLTYKNRCLAEYSAVHGRDNNFDARVNFEVFNASQARLVVKNNLAGKENEISWFTIGF